MTPTLANTRSWARSRLRTSSPSGDEGRVESSARTSTRSRQTELGRHERARRSS